MKPPPGAEIVIARAGKPMARLVPLAAAPHRRVLGAMKGQFTYPDDFLDPLPDDLLDVFEGK